MTMKRLRPIWGLWCLVSASAAFQNAGLSIKAGIRQRQTGLRSLRVIGQPEVNGNVGTGENHVLVSKFAADISKLAEMRPPFPSADISAIEIFISAGSSYTKLWTHETWKRHATPPHVRYFRHVWRWSASTTARRVLPAVLIAVAWATVVSLAATFWPHFGNVVVSKQTGASAAASALSAPLALLLTLRANSSMERLLEARKAWGRVVLHSSALANIVQLYLMPIAPEAAILAARHLSVLGWILKAKLRDESEETQQQVLQTMLSGDDYEWLVSQTNRPFAILSRLRQIAALGFQRSPTGWSSNTPLTFVEERLHQLEVSVGVTDRIFTSPIPPTYSRHLSRVLSLWCFFTPIHLVSLGFRTPGVILTTAIACYVFMGIDEVGMEIERPSVLLPLQQLAGRLQNSVRDQFVMEGGGGMPRVP